MTALEDAFAISNAILVLVCLPTFLHVCSITLPALQSGAILTTAARGSVFFMDMIGVGSFLLSILICVAGVFIEGEFAE